MLSYLVLYPMAALLGGMILQLLLARYLSALAKGWLAFASAVLAAVAVAAQVPAVHSAGDIHLTLLDWDRGISFIYRVDGLSLVFNLMAAVIGAAILLYCVRYMQHEESGLTRFYALMLTFIAGLIQLVSSANLLMAYVSWEIIGLCSYFLVGFWYQQPAAAQGARKVLLITHLAGYALLAGILILFIRSGSLDWNDAALQAAFTTPVFLLFLIAAMAKSVVFPLHTWIPEAMNAPTPVSALLHSACYVKAGIYLIARMYSITNWQPAWNTLVLFLGCVTMLVGAFFALAQTDLKRLLAYSTISQLGHIIMALGLGTSLGITAALFYTISHGLFKGTLFLCAGAVQHATGTRDMRQMGGLARKMPKTAFIWLIAAASIIGVPICNGFIAKWLLLDAALASGQLVVILLAWFVSILTAFYMLKATAGVFYGDMPEWLAKRPLEDAAPGMISGMGFLAALCLVFGIVPQLLIISVVQPAVAALGFQNELHLSWLGLQTETAGIGISAGALILLTALLVGAAVYLVSRPARKGLTANTFTGGDPLPVEAGIYNASDFTDLVETAVQPVYRFSDPDPLLRRSWRSIQSLSERFTEAVTPLFETRSIIVLAILALLLALLVGLAGR